MCFIYVRIKRLKKQTGVLPFVVCAILIYSGYCLERSFRVGVDMDAESPLKTLLGNGARKNSLISSFLSETKIDDQFSVGLTNQNNEQNSKNLFINNGQKLQNMPDKSFTDPNLSQMNSPPKKVSEENLKKPVKKISVQIVRPKLNTIESTNQQPLAKNSEKSEKDSEESEQKTTPDPYLPSPEESTSTHNDSVQLKERKIVFDDTFEQNDFLRELKRSINKKENAISKAKTLLTELKKTGGFLREDLKMFEENFNQFLKNSANYQNILLKADISPDSYKIDLEDLKKEVESRLEITSLLEKFLTVSKNGQPGIIEKMKSAFSSNSKKKMEPNQQFKQQSAQSNLKKATFRPEESSMADNQASNIMSENIQNITENDSKMNDMNQNTSFSKQFEQNETNTSKINLKNNSMEENNSYESNLKTDHDQDDESQDQIVQKNSLMPKQNDLTSLIHANTLETRNNLENYSSASNFLEKNNFLLPFENRLFLTEKKEESSKDTQSSDFDHEEIENLGFIQAFMVVQGLICLVIFILMVCNLLNIIPPCKLILLVVLIGNVFIGIVSMIYAQALAKRCIIMDVPNCQNRNLFDVEEVVDILNEREEPKTENVVHFIQSKFKENSDELSIFVEKFETFMKSNESKALHKVDVFRNMINKLMFIESDFEPTSKFFSPVYTMKRSLEDIKHQIVSLSNEQVFPIYRELLEAQIFFDDQKDTISQRIENFLKLNMKRKEDKANDDCKKEMKKICKARKDYEQLAFALVVFGLIFVILVCF
uniref:repetitive organellar protein-like n=1 Tax=Doryrhamphus excisus TaxID=161450 RepID=UPI0025AE7DB2|nr:repetitive organellar protein-like [Doryrhamphus excisus]XP_057909391.1 repetitive organellar protein-like [Doryrhamphus excisus]